jgi:hypothetical protein
MHLFPQALIAGEDPRRTEAVRYFVQVLVGLPDMGSSRTLLEEIAAAIGTNRYMQHLALTNLITKEAIEQNKSNRIGPFADAVKKLLTAYNTHAMVGVPDDARAKAEDDAVSAVLEMVGRSALQQFTRPSTGFGQVLKRGSEMAKGWRRLTALTGLTAAAMYASGSIVGFANELLHAQTEGIASKEMLSTELILASLVGMAASATRPGANAALSIPSGVTDMIVTAFLIYHTLEGEKKIADRDSALLASRIGASLRGNQSLEGIRARARFLRGVQCVCF